MSELAKRAKYTAKDLATKVKILKALKDSASREEAQIMEAFEPRVACECMSASACESKLPLSGPLIRAQAERYALRMNIDSFKASVRRMRRPAKTRAMNYARCVVPQKKPRTLSSF
ncbi:hypothetical protein HPB52_009611 [Rhipicephalus sanguineus]|uniref:Uncharacterized protein n=1 Tax=Rhipicephalus sanguineus TaxID=34632 RepID=A0A9D4QEB9_RHISA|nr:hypothetical protein HPB52_009611 [Rhipicephalus sanguineus]